MTWHDVWQVSQVAALAGLAALCMYNVGWLARDRRLRRERQDTRSQIAGLREQLWRERRRGNQAWDAGYAQAQQDMDALILAVRATEGLQLPPPRVQLTPAGALDEAERVLRAARAKGRRP